MPVSAIGPVSGLASASAETPLRSAAIGMSGVGAIEELTVPTYDGSGEATHPSVVYVPDLWNGYPYWMAFTPYPSEDPDYENPSIVASLDGVTWVVPTGLTNPIEAFPGALSYNSDTDLTLVDGVMYCVWRQFNNAATNKEQIYVLSSADGATWGDRTLLFENDSTVRRLVSPSLIHEADGSWRMFAVDIIPSPNTIVSLTADTITGTWSAPTVVADWGGIPSGREPWHLSAWREGGEYMLLVDDIAVDVSGVEGDLFLASSRDGDTFTGLGQFPAISRHYRTCVVPAQVNGVKGYEVWYSKIDRILHGFVETSALTTGQSPPSVLAAAVAGISPFVFADVVDRADNAASPGTATTGETWTVYGGTWGAYSGALGISANANGKAVVDIGVADCEFGFTAASPPGSGGNVWIMARGSDTNNYWRFGRDSDNAIKLQSVEAGAVAQSQTVPGSLLADGTEFRVTCYGDIIRGYVAGFEVLSVDDDFNNTATEFGIQTNRPATRVTSIYAKA